MNHASGGAAIRSDASQPSNSTTSPRTRALAVIVAALLLGASATPAVSIRPPQPGSSLFERDEPPRPPQAVLNAVRPLGLAISIGEPFETPSEDAGQTEWVVPVECRIADGEAERRASPTPAERWLFGVLWGGGSTPPPKPRSYIQAVPKLTLSVSATPDGDPYEAAWAIFVRCPTRDERILLPLWPEHAALLASGSASAWMLAEAVGMPRDHPSVIAVNDAMANADSTEEAWVTMAPMVAAWLNGELFTPVDGLVNGGPVFNVTDFAFDLDLSRVPTDAVDAEAMQQALPAGTIDALRDAVNDALR